MEKTDPVNAVDNEQKKLIRPNFPHEKNMNFGPLRVDQTQSYNEVG